ncbi:MAG: cytochrome P450 [Polyangiaceae bacterium]
MTPKSTALAIRSTKPPPGPTGMWASLENIRRGWRDPLSLLTETTRKYGKVAMARFGPMRYVVVEDPVAIKHVLLDNVKNYVKSRNYSGIKLLLGNGLLTSEGDFWRRQRKLSQPAFHRDRMNGFVESMALATDAAIVRWNEMGKGRSFEVDVHEEMTRLTFHIVGLTLLSQDLLGDAEVTGKALTVAMYFANEYAESLVALPLWVPTPKNRSFVKARAALDQMVFRIIAERRARRVAEESDDPKSPGNKAKSKGDLLDMLMEARDEETGEGMSDRQLRDEVMTLILAGHETTANALTFTFYLLSKHPEILRKLQNEVREVLGDRSPQLSDLPKLSLTKRVLEESMRLYPPAWMFERQALEDDEINGFHVPKGSVIGVCTYVLHRDPDNFENPEGFDPDRFLGDPKDRAKYTYLPFGGGTRVCIGNAFAMMEAQIVLAKIVQSYRFDLLPNTKLELDPVITLRPRGGLKMKLSPRA